MHKQLHFKPRYARKQWFFGTYAPPPFTFFCYQSLGSMQCYGADSFMSNCLDKHTDSRTRVKSNNNHDSVRSLLRKDANPRPIFSHFILFVICNNQHVIIYQKGTRAYGEKRILTRKESYSVKTTISWIVHVEARTQSFSSLGFFTKNGEIHWANN